MTYKELIAILQAHKTWITNEKGGQRANLSGINLVGIKLNYTNLSYANLSYTNLSYAKLSYVNLRYANLRYANFNYAKLTDVNLNGTDLTGANFSNVNLRGVNLREANLSNIKADFLAALATLPAEVPFLRKTLIDGKIDGSAYVGKCCCLAGTMAHACGATNFYDWLRTTHFPIDMDSARECWFYAIRPGMTPANNQVAAITLEWIDEFLMVQS